MELSKNTGINKNIIQLIEDNQPLYEPIYTLSLIELETLKGYIKTHLKIVFIWLSKFLTSASIFFDKKPDGSFYLCINYRDVNNLTIKNWYPLTQIEKFFDRLDWAKRFTQLDLTSVYHRMKLWEDDK